MAKNPNIAIANSFLRKFLLRTHYPDRAAAALERLILSERTIQEIRLDKSRHTPEAVLVACGKDPKDFIYKGKGWESYHSDNSTQHYSIRLCGFGVDLTLEELPRRIEQENNWGDVKVLPVIGLPELLRQKDLALHYHDIAFTDAYWIDKKGGYKHVAFLARDEGKLTPKLEICENGFGSSVVFPIVTNRHIACSG